MFALTHQLFMGREGGEGVLIELIILHIRHSALGVGVGGGGQTMEEEIMKKIARFIEAGVGYGTPPPSVGDPY